MASAGTPREPLPESVSTNGRIKMELANRLFFRLYQCANMMHKTGTRAVEAEGLTTQRWAVLGALSRPQAEAGMSVGDLALYLMVSRQNLSVLIRSMERDGHLTIRTDGRDRRSRLVAMTVSGLHLWQAQALPKIHVYYEQILSGFSVDDMTHTLHYLLKMLDQMRRVDRETRAVVGGATEWPGSDELAP